MPNRIRVWVNLSWKSEHARRGRAPTNSRQWRELDGAGERKLASRSPDEFRRSTSVHLAGKSGRMTTH